MNTQALDNMKARRSCRAFLPDMPARDLIEKVCEAGTWAPTGHGKQSPLIVAITRKDLRDRLSAMNGRIWNELKVQRGELNAQHSSLILTPSMVPPWCCWSLPTARYPPTSTTAAP